MSEHQQTSNDGSRKSLQQQPETPRQDEQITPETSSQQSQLDARRMTPSRLLYLQRTVGNAATRRLLATSATHAAEQAGNTSLIARQPKASFMESKLARKLPEQKAQKNSIRLEDTLKSGVEHLARLSLDDVKLHHNAEQRGGMPAHTYAQRSEIDDHSGLWQSDAAELSENFANEPASEQAPLNLLSAGRSAYRQNLQRAKSPIKVTPSRPATMQRLMSHDELLAKAGEPTADTFGGWKKKAKRYKSLLAALKTYDTLTAKPVPADEKKAPDELSKALTNVETARAEFVKRYDGLTGLSAWKNSVERARLPHVKALEQDIKGEQKALDGFPGERSYAGQSWREAIRLYKAWEIAGPLKKEIIRLADMKDAKDKKVSVEALRDQILGLESADVKKVLLADGELKAIIKDRLSKEDALILAAVLLDRALEWWSGSGPDEKEGFQIRDTKEADGTRNDFAHWIRSGREDDPSKPDLSSGKMNCWEGVLFSMYVAGVVSYDTLRQMHVQAAREGVAAKEQASDRMLKDMDYAKERMVDVRVVRHLDSVRGDAEKWVDTQSKDLAKYTALEKNAANQMGNNAYYFRIAENLGAHDAKVWNKGDPPPPAGNIVFFVGSKSFEQIQKYAIAHVCISLGRQSKEGTDIMNFGFTANSKTIWGRTTIEGFLKGKYSGYLCKYGPSTLLTGGLSLRPARGIDSKDELL
jgi:hypothetical protein